MYKVYTGSGFYDFEVLISSYPSLEPFVFYGKSNRQTIDFSDAKAVRALNTALLKHNYRVKYWEFSERNLCPPIPGRVQYIHLLADLLKSSGINGDIKILDIGTGASCIYPILGYKEYGWRFVATEIVESSLDSAEQILKKNNLSSIIELKFQSNPEYIFKDIIKPEDRFSASICNPPFYKSEAEAKQHNEKKLRNLKLNKTNSGRNFGGIPTELIYRGGEKAFLHNYLYQSSLFKTNCYWYTSLVSKKELIKNIKSSLLKLGATEIKIIPMHLGNKISRAVAWTFLDSKERTDW